MERTKYLLVTLVFILLSCSLRASYKQEVYKAYIGNDIGKWKRTMDEMARVHTPSNDFILELVNYQYGYIGWCLGNDKKKEAGEYLNLARRNIQVLQKNGFKPSHQNAYLSAFYGFEIGLNSLKAPFVGPKSVKCAQLAMQLDKLNPYGYIQYANTQYYMPAAFGGSKTVALEYYLKAEKLMEKNSREDWNYLNLLTLIAQAYESTGNNSLAKHYYEKILKTEPGFLWVKNELYPQFLKKINQK